MTTKNTTPQKRLAGSKVGAVPYQKLAVNQTKKSAQIQNPVPKKHENSRIFNQGEYPAPVAKAPASVASPISKPTSQSGLTTTQVKKSFLSSHLSKNPGLQATSEIHKTFSATPTAPTNHHSANQYLEVNRPELIWSKANEYTIPHAANGPLPMIDYTNSMSTSARNGHHEEALEGESLDDSTCETCSQSLLKPGEIETSEVVEHSEHSSTTVQADVTHPSEVAVDVDFEASSEAKDDDYFPAPNNRSEYELSFTEKDNEYPGDRIGGVKSESFEDTWSSDAEIFTSPSQRMNIEMSKPMRALNRYGDERVFMKPSTSTAAARSRHSSSIQFKDGVAEIVHSTVIGDQDGSTHSEQEDPQTVAQATAFLIRDRFVDVSGPFFQAPDLVVSEPSRLLLTEEVGSRAASTQKITICSDTYSSNGAKIPNFYYVPSDDEDSTTEKTTLKANPSKVVSPKIRSTTHSARTGCALPNFYCIPSDNEDSDLEKTRPKVKGHADEAHVAPPHSQLSDPLPDGPYTQELKSPVYTELVTQAYIMDVTASYFHSNLPHSDGNFSPKSTPQAPVMDATASNFETRLPLLDGSHELESASSDHKQSATQALSMDAATSNLDGDLGVEKTTPKVKDQGPVINVTASEFQTSLPLLDDNQAQDSTYSGCTDSTPNSASYVSQDLHYSSQPAESSYPLQFSNPGFDVAPAQNLYLGPPLFHQGHSMPPMTTDTGLNSGVESSQAISQQDSPHQQSEEPQTKNGNASFHNTDSSWDPDPVDTDKKMPMTPAVSGFTANCTYCGYRTDPSIQNRQVICSGCGPTSSIRYCSVACLLVDSLDHSRHCMNYPASDRAAYHNLPSTFFVYVLNPIMPGLGYLETPERFRQKAFSMYCSSGSFPKLFRCWMKKSGIILTAQPHSDLNEKAKRTGDYAIFRSHHTLARPRDNPNAEVIFRQDNFNLASKHCANLRQH